MDSTKASSPQCGTLLFSHLILLKLFKTPRKAGGIYWCECDKFVKEGKLWPEDGCRVEIGQRNFNGGNVGKAANKKWDHPMDRSGCEQWRGIINQFVIYCLVLRPAGIPTTGQEIRSNGGHSIRHGQDIILWGEANRNQHFPLIKLNNNKNKKDIFAGCPLLCFRHSILRRPSGPSIGFAIWFNG